jgi:Ca2+-binding RTX toxin-like protein
MFDNVIEHLESRFMLAAPIFSSFQPHNPPIFLHDGVLTIRGGPGNDRISFSVKLPPSYSSENPDYLVKVRFNDQTHWFHRSKIQLVDIDAGAGDDLIMLRSPPLPCEQIRAPLQPDDGIQLPCVTLIIAGPAKISGGSGNDTIYGSDLNDTIDAGSGNDLIYGMSGSDRIFGKAGNDTIYGGQWSDHISGGAGKDTAWDPDGSRRSIEQIRRT